MGGIAKVKLSLKVSQIIFITSFLLYQIVENPTAVGFAAIVGGGVVGCFLLILIVLVLVAVLIWVVRQLNKEKAIAAEG